MTENPQDRLQYYRETGQTEQAKLYEQYLRETGQWQDERKPAVRGAAADATMALPRERDGASGDYEAAAPLLGVPAALLSHVPGGEAAQSAVRALVRGQSYGDARRDIRGAVEDAPAVARIPAKIAGGAISAMAVPGSMIKQGAAHGALNSLLDADPDRGLVSRGAGAVMGGVTEGALGAAGMAAGALKNAPKGAVKAVAKELAPQNIQRAVRKWGALNDAVRPKAITSPVVGSITPKTDGLIGNSMDNVLEAVKAQSAGSADDVLSAVPTRNQPLFDAFSNEARVADEALQQSAPQLGPRLPDVIKVTHRNRTESGALQRNAPQARYDWFAERMAKRKP